MKTAYSWWKIRTTCCPYHGSSVVEEKRLCRGPYLKMTFYPADGGQLTYLKFDKPGQTGRYVCEKGRWHEVQIVWVRKYASHYEFRRRHQEEDDD